MIIQLCSLEHFSIFYRFSFLLHNLIGLFFQQPSFPATEGDCCKQISWDKSTVHNFLWKIIGEHN